MAQVKVDFSAALKEDFINEAVAREAGLAVVNMFKKLIASGQSPVRGYGRFAPYKAQRDGEDNPNHYPNPVKGKFGKKIRPVNLWLDGTYLSHFTWRWSKRKQRVSIGFKDNAPQKIKDMFEAHNEGMHPDVPQRKHLPNKEGEEWKVSIMRALIAVFEKRNKALIEKINRK